VRQDLQGGHLLDGFEVEREESPQDVCSQGKQNAFIFHKFNPF